MVALLRGINVGGKNILPMQQLREILTKLSCRDVATYIQSGNAVFNYDGASDDLAAGLEKAIFKANGFKPTTLIVGGDDFAEIAAGNPFEKSGHDEKFLHTLFLRDAARSANLERLQVLASESEQFSLTDKAFYLLAPDGIGRSKLVSQIERHLKVEATGRNGRTVSKIKRLLDDLIKHRMMRA